MTLGTREAGKLKDWAAKNPGAKVGDFAAAAAFGEIVVLAVGGAVALDALKLVGAANIAGKTVIDACNPIGGGPPVHGVLTFFTSLTDSLMERLQKAYPAAHFVKAFNSVGAAQMVDPHFSGGKPTMFICGDDEPAKRAVTRLLDQFGWETADMGAGRGGARDRASVHALVHPRRRPQRLVAARLQAAAVKVARLTEIAKKGATNGRPPQP